MKIKTLLILYFVLLISIFPNESKFKLSEKNQINIDINSWLFVFSVFNGVGSNINKIPIPVLQFKQTNNLEIYQDNKKYDGYGNGNGFQILGFKQNWQFSYLNYAMKLPNQDRNPLYNLWQTIETKIAIQNTTIRYNLFHNEATTPFISYNYFKGIGPIQSSQFKNLTSFNFIQSSWIFFPQANIKVYNEDPNFQIGLSFKLPIQNWQFDTFYIYSLEETKIKIDSFVGKTIPFESKNFSLNNFFLKFYDYTNTEEWIQPLRYTINSKNYSQRIGINLFLDYQRFLSLILNINKDLAKNRTIFNMVFNLIFPNYVGFSIVYYEIMDRNIVKIQYLLYGPTIVFFF